MSPEFVAKLQRCKDLNSLLSSNIQKDVLHVENPAPMYVSSDVVRKSTVGVMFDGTGLIENVLIGGPASASRKIRKGDRVICDRRKQRKRVGSK